jgi:hypothetical protein
VEDTGAGMLSLGVRRHRLERLCQAYAQAGDSVAIGARDVLRTAIDRLADLAVFTAERAAAGATQVGPHVQVYRDDAGWLEEHLDDLAALR